MIRRHMQLFQYYVFYRMNIELTEIHFISFKNWTRYLSRDIKILKIGNEGSEIMINISEN